MPPVPEQTRGPATVLHGGRARRRVTAVLPRPLERRVYVLHERCTSARAMCCVCPRARSISSARSISGDDDGSGVLTPRFPLGGKRRRAVFFFPRRTVRSGFRRSTATAGSRAAFIGGRPLKPAAPPMTCPHLELRRSPRVMTRRRAKAAVPPRQIFSARRGPDPAPSAGFASGRGARRDVLHRAPSSRPSRRVPRAVPDLSLIHI